MSSCNCLNKMKHTICLNFRSSYWGSCLLHRGLIESAKGDCRTRSNDKYSIATLFDVPQWTSRELKTLYLSDQNNQNNGCQMKNTNAIGIPLRYRSAFAFMNIPIGFLFQSAQFSQPWEDIHFTCKHCIDIPRTPVAECRHLSVKICMRAKGEDSEGPGIRYDYRWSHTYLPYKTLSVVLKYQIRSRLGFVVLRRVRQNFGVVLLCQLQTCFFST